MFLALYESQVTIAQGFSDFFKVKKKLSPKGTLKRKNKTKRSDDPAKTGRILKCFCAEQGRQTTTAQGFFDFL